MAASVITGVAYHLFALGEVGDVGRFVGVGAVVAAVMLPLLILYGAYRPTSLHSFRVAATTFALLWVLVILFLISVAFLLKISDVFSRGASLALTIAGLPMILIVRYAVSRLVVRAAGSGHLKMRRIALICEGFGGPGDSEISFIQKLGFRVARVFPITGDAAGPELQRTVDSVLASVRGSDIDEIHLMLGSCRLDQIDTILSAFRSTPLRVRLIPSGPAAQLLQHPQRSLGDRVMFDVQRGPLSGAERVAKRSLDLVLAGLGLFLLFPLLLVVALAIRLDSPGPVLFRQNRNGFNGRPFAIFKFRTMRVMEDGPVVVQAKRNDSRITPVGRWLRRTSIDELPQLFNVIRGEMSLIGPRPHALAHDDEYMKVIATYAYRHHMRPGITGWAQVNGYRGETPTVGHMERRVELDMWYIENWSFWLDVRILIRTCLEVVRSRNAY